MVRIRQEALKRRKHTSLFFFPLKLISENHYAADIEKRLQQILATGQMSQVVIYLQTLSHARFRTAGYVLGERIMLQCPADTFWLLAHTLVQFDNRAFLVTVIKSYLNRVERVGDIGLLDVGFQKFCLLLRPNEEDCRKALQQLLPALAEPQQIRHLFSLLGIEDQVRWIPFLLQCRTMPSYYLLFNSLHFIEHDTDRLVRIAYYLTRSGDALSFNLASLMKAYFGLSQVRGTFSLHLRPYELARIASSYDVFCQKMQF